MNNQRTLQPQVLSIVGLILEDNFRADDTTTITVLSGTQRFDIDVTLDEESN
jgi:hypothetical protein